MRFRGWVDALIWPCSPGVIPKQFMQFGTQLYPAAIRKCLEKEVQCCSRVHVFTSPVSGLNECIFWKLWMSWCVVLREICSLLFLLEIRHITGIPNNEHLGQETT